MTYSALIPLLLVAAIAFCGAEPEERIAPGSGTDDVSKLISDLFDSKVAPFSSTRHPIKGKLARESMLQFIKNRVDLIRLRTEQTKIRSTVELIPYNTTILNLMERRDVQANNLVFILHGKANETEDEPILFLANYDSPENCNQVDEGSGVVALLSLAELIVNEVYSRKLTLKKSVVFAFTDVAYRKYTGNHASEGLTGGSQIARDWLPRFLLDRKSFRGAIVLDNIMNYNDRPKSQLVSSISLDKSFPSSYQEIAEGDFTGNFLGLVHRDYDQLDHELVSALEKAFRQSMKEVRGVDLSQQKLVRFPFSSDFTPTPSINHFLDSEQSSFWNQHVHTSIKTYGAVLLTDTRLYRLDTAGCILHCEVGHMKTEKNLAFMKRIVNTLQIVVLDWQTNANGALSNFQSSSILLFAPLIAFLFSRA